MYKYGCGALKARANLPRIEQVTYIEAGIEAVFDFHLDLNNLLRVSPPEARLQIFYAPEKIEQGVTIGLFVRIGPITTTMESVVAVLDRPHKLVDEQVGGFFARWVHTHLFERITETKTRLTDIIDYQLPGGLLANLIAGGIAQSKIEDLFRHRAEMTKKILENKEQ